MEDIQDLKDQEKYDYADSHDEIEKDDSSSEWVWGLVLIGIGVFLLTRPLGWALFQNWWALFILVPAGMRIVGAFRGGRANMQALIGGLFMATIGVIFLFGLSWSLFWPVILILLGIQAIWGAKG